MPLFELAAIPGPSGWESAVADYVASACQSMAGVEVRRLGDLVVARKGRPRSAVFAHMDTVGFTLGYERALIPIGQPDVKGGEELRPVRGDLQARGTIVREEDELRLETEGEPDPGGAWVYARRLEQQGDTLLGPYLDNRAGVWNALQAVRRAPDILAIFTTGEEHSGRGALIGARLLYEEYGLTQALISDITWHTDHIHCGRGPAVSLRDRYVPPQPFVERVLAAATASGIPFQREIESAGSSDGGWLERSGYPIDWVFIGAPQKRSHTSLEEVWVQDLAGMLDLYVALLERL
jgi:putative aminopeptidase FrvX